MASTLNRLTAKAVDALKTPGKHSDGGGLYLLVDKAGARRWLHIYQLNGKRREMGLGPLHLVPLAAARERRDENGRMLLAGLDPLEEQRKALDRERAAAEAKELADAVPFFEAFAIEVADSLDVKREGTRANWKASVAPKSTPKLTGKRVNEIVTADVLATLEPIWNLYPVKAKKLRQKIEYILNVARAKLYMGPLDRPYQNPAQWDGHLKLLLPKRKHKAKHYSALPYDEIGTFMAALRKRPGVRARALEFLILTVPRGHEVRQMRVKNVDVEARLWRVPDEDQKSDKEYLLPLADRPLEIVKERLAQLGPNPDPEAFVFPCLEHGANFKQPLSKAALRNLVVAMGYAGRATPHGFRSTFRDWAGDCTAFAREVIEHCLSHAVGDEVELAYRRSDALEKRREVLAAWAKRCADVKADKVVAFKGGKKRAVG